MDTRSITYLSFEIFLVIREDYIIYITCIKVDIIAEHEDKEVIEIVIL